MESSLSDIPCTKKGLKFGIPVVVVLMKSLRIPLQSGLADIKNFDVYERSEFFKNFLSEKVDGI